MDNIGQKNDSSSISPTAHPTPPPLPKKSNKLPLVFIFFLLIVITAGAGWILHNNKQTATIGKNETTAKSTSALPPTLPATQFNLQPINEGQIALLENNKIYLLDTATMQKRELSSPTIEKDNPSTFTFSNDGNTLFTALGPATGNTDFAIYNMITGHTIALSNLEPNPRVDTSSDVSPNDHYFILTQSCCPGDSGRIIMSIDGKIIKKLVGGAIAWSPNSTMLAISKGDVTLDLPLGPQPTNNSVYVEKIAGDTVTESIIIKATQQENYIPVKWINNHMLLIQETTYSQAFPTTIDQNQQTQDHWMQVFQHPTTSYFTMDTITLIPSNTTYTEKAIVLNTSYSSDNKWKVFTEGNSLIGPTFISKSDGSDKMKISDHAYAVWRPKAH